MVVSIPAGFSDALRLLRMVDMKAQGTDEFQSLLGFLMCCDLLLRIDCQVIRLVSIPAGFSDALRHEVDIFLACTTGSFNPCWVF